MDLLLIVHPKNLPKSWQKPSPNPLKNQSKNQHYFLSILASNMSPKTFEKRTKTQPENRCFLWRFLMTLAGPPPGVKKHEASPPRGSIYIGDI